MGIWRRFNTDVVVAVVIIVTTAVVSYHIGYHNGRMVDIVKADVEEYHKRCEDHIWYCPECGQEVK